MITATNLFLPSSSLVFSIHDVSIFVCLVLSLYPFIFLALSISDPFSLYISTYLSSPLFIWVTHTHTHSLILSATTLSPSHPHSHSHFLSLSHTQSLTHSLSHTLSLSLSFLALSLSFCPSFCSYISLSFSLSVCVVVHGHECVCANLRMHDYVSVAYAPCLSQAHAFCGLSPRAGRICENRRAFEQACTRSALVWHFV